MSFFHKLARLTSAFPPLREVLSENGVGSYSRYTGFALLVSTIFWITYLVIRNHALPDLEGPAIFITASQTQYGLNQMKKVAQARQIIKGGDQQPIDSPEGVHPDVPSAP